MNDSKNDVCVVHLVRAANGIEPFIRFLNSYKENEAGIPHDLFFIFKGFSSSEALVNYFSVAEGIEFSSCQIPDIGFDIDAYFSVIHKLEYRYFCFLNSYSVILSENWLNKLYRCFSVANVGLVGATGSFQSIKQNNHPLLSFHKFKNTVFSKRHPLWKVIALKIMMYGYLLRHSISYVKCRKYFDDFPNMHIRTNAFMASKNDLLKIDFPKIHNKFDAHRFESGKDSLTKQIIRMGKISMVVGKDGNAYKEDDWGRSNTFWQKNQSNLLIADNQTANYELGHADVKTRYAESAWGSESDSNE